MEPNNIKAIRIQCGLTQEELASMVGITRQTLMRYENGGPGTLKLSVLEKISQALKVSLQSLTGFIPNEEKVVRHIPVASEWVNEDLVIKDYEELVIMDNPDMELFVYEVTDDDLFPDVKIGDRLTVNTSLEPEDNDMVLVINRETNETMIRYYIKEAVSDQIILLALKRECKPLLYINTPFFVKGVFISQFNQRKKFY